MFWIGVGIAFAGWCLATGLENLGYSVREAVDLLCLTIKSINNK